MTLQIVLVCSLCQGASRTPTTAQADQARLEHLQRSHSVTRLATSGQFVLAADRQIPMTANRSGELLNITFAMLPGQELPGLLRQARAACTVSAL